MFFIPSFVPEDFVTVWFLIPYIFACVAMLALGRLAWRVVVTSWFLIPATFAQWQAARSFERITFAAHSSNDFAAGSQMEFVHVFHSNLSVFGIMLSLKVCHWTDVQLD